MASASEEISVSELYFDPENPRLAALFFDKNDEAAVLQHMLQEEALVDLIASIADQGFFEGEPLLVYKKEGSSGYVVVEGNRRLSALKILNNPGLAKLPSVLKIVSEAEYRPQSVPCLVFSKREDILVYLGYKHITGTKAWGSLEKATYLFQLKELLLKRNPELAGNNGEVHKHLARQIGSKSPTVGKTLTAYAIYVNGKDKNGTFFDIQGLDASQINFSLIYTALGYEHIYAYLGLESAVDVEMKDFNAEHGKNLFRWLFLEDRFGKTAVPDSRQLSDLSEVLKSEKATAHFERNQDLALAFRLSDGYFSAFDKTVEDVERNRKELDRLVDIIGDEVYQEEQTFSELQANKLEDLGEDFERLAAKIRRIIRRKVRSGVE